MTLEELRAKLADGSITDEEKEQLETLEADEAAKEEEEKPAADDAKELVSLGKKLAQIAITEMKNSMAVDAKKAIATNGNTEKKQPELKGKELANAFFNALFEGDREKLDHLSSTAADGGYLVPQEYADTFVEARQDEVVMRKAGATVVKMNGNTFNIPQLGSRPKAYWTNELAAKSSTSANWANISLTPYTLAAYMTASNQVIADAKIGGNLVDIMTSFLTRAIAEAEDKAFFTGSGSGQPTGLNSYTVRTVSAGGSLDADDIINAVYLLAQPYRKTAAIFANTRVIKVIRQLKDNQGRYIFENAIAGRDFPTVMGIPLYEQNDLETSSLWVGDASSYWIGDREGVTVRVSDEATVGGQSAFERNFTIVRVEERVDGELADTAGFVEITNTSIS